MKQHTTDAISTTLEKIYKIKSTKMDETEQLVKCLLKELLLLYITRVTSQKKDLSTAITMWSIIGSSEYWCKDEKVTIVLQGKRLS